MILFYLLLTIANIYHIHVQNKAQQELSAILKKAAMDDNTVIITSLNEPWARPGSLLDLFLESFREGEQISHLLNHLVIVAMDPKAYQRCKEVHFYCYFLETKGVNYTTEKFFMTKDYLEMMWGRNGFQLSILELGYNFLFTVGIALLAWLWFCSVPLSNLSTCIYKRLGSIVPKV